MFNFIKSASTSDQYINDNKPEVCFIGRSNVGKSSIINDLAKAKIAKTSSTPGRTQLVNFFDSKHFRLVDLPGYGFAKLNKQQQSALEKIIQEYFIKSKNLKVIVHICDANVIMDQDIEISKYLQTLNKKYILVLNKVDKQKMYWYNNNLQKYLSLFNLEQNQIIFTSTKTNYNINELFNFINKSIKGNNEKSK